MEPTTTTIEATATAPRPLTTTEIAFNYLMFGMSVVITAAFSYYLLSDTGRLVETWMWIRQLSLVVQLVLWLLFLPWMFALWVWAQPWSFALRLVLVLGTLAFTEYLLCPWKP